MHPRAYSLTLAAVAASLFLVVVGTNLILDPQGVFGTGLFGSSPNANTRYSQLAAYRAEPRRFDGLLFGSSRAQHIPRDNLSQRFNRVHFAYFGFDGGSVADHLPMLEYVLKDKAARHEPLRAVFLLLDVDSLGAEPKANKSIQTLFPPELTGEPAARFWWKNATAIQFHAWKSSIKSSLGWIEPSGPNIPGFDVAGITTPADEQALQVSRAAKPRIPIASSNRFPQHLHLLRRFVSLCREHGVAHVVAAGPLHPIVATYFDRSEIERAVQIVSNIVPVWDFTQPDWLPNNPELWHDPMHFKPQVGEMMIARIFGDEIPPDMKEVSRIPMRRHSGTTPALMRER